ncbi:hypothetical protein M422DRAFT_259984 [Sphaerobolus stellatus SS14]|uniref:Uncharacterized protein n=1 Tax=Sphaerobolus stellatus (strain SS14) TaxID=990650 RepID=A0A0C9US23_SPHS4|nr:hypothetical protein M422DRAFT_259984 [Sphaerobolus stellatus SS14]
MSFSLKKPKSKTKLTMRGVSVSLALGDKDAPKAELVNIEVDEEIDRANATVYIGKDSSVGIANGIPRNVFIPSRNMQST